MYRSSRFSRVPDPQPPFITRTFYGGFQGTTAVRAIASVSTSSASASVISWARLLTDGFGGGNPFASFLIALTWIAAAR